MLRFAIGEAVRDRRTLASIQQTLWREDAAEVAAIFDSRHLRDKDGTPGPVDRRHGLLAERMRELLRPMVWRPKRGLTVGDLAQRAGVDRATMASALEHHGYLELVPFGGRQRRRLLTDCAVNAGYGHNADASQVRVAAVEGFHRAAVFPVIYPEHAASILWTLNLLGIRDGAAALPTKRARLRWLMQHHGYLPNAFISDLAGCTERAVEKARARGETAGSSVRSHGSERSGSTGGATQAAMPM
jgi:hypothetical protein